MAAKGRGSGAILREIPRNTELELFTNFQFIIYLLQFIIIQILHREMGFNHTESTQEI